MIPKLFTIGHSDQGIFAFVRRLHSHGIDAVADVRSHPVSRRHPQYNKAVLASALKEAGVVYVFLGRELGARRAEPSCYVEGRADYGRIAALPLFQEGLRRVREGLRTHRIALMCAEGDPLYCHRSILVCRHLRDEGIRIRHIRKDGTLEDHAALEARLLEALRSEPGLFDEGPERDRLIELAYDIQGKRIAYTPKRG